MTRFAKTDPQILAEAPESGHAKQIILHHFSSFWHPPSPLLHRVSTKNTVQLIFWGGVGGVGCVKLWAGTIWATCGLLHLQPTWNKRGWGVRGGPGTNSIQIRPDLNIQLKVARAQTTKRPPQSHPVVTPKTNGSAASQENGTNYSETHKTQSSAQYLSLPVLSLFLPTFKWIF